MRLIWGADLLQVVIWVTPAGTMDDGGLVQPAYLNFDAALLGPPASHEMQASPHYIALLHCLVSGTQHRNSLFGSPQRPALTQAYSSGHGILDNAMPDMASLVGAWQWGECHN